MEKKVEVEKKEEEEEDVSDDVRVIMTMTMMTMTAYSPTFQISRSQIQSSLRRQQRSILSEIGGAIGAQVVDRVGLGEDDDLLDVALESFGVGVSA